MKIKEFLTEAKLGPKTPGHERLVSSIIAMLQKKGKKVSRGAITSYLKKIDADEAFKQRVSEKAKKVGNPGYIWASVRYRTVGHFLGSEKE